MTDALLLIALFLQFADYWTTRRVIERGGRELNVVLLYWRDLLARFGVGQRWAWLISAKACAAVVILAAHSAGAWEGWRGMALLFGLVLFYGYVVFKNARVLRGMA